MASVSQAGLAALGLQSRCYLRLVAVAYDACGNATFYTPTWTPTTNTLAFRVLYQGGWFDPATGLYMFQHRDFNPALQRWMQQDPLGYVNGPSTYQADGDNSISETDPTGCSSIPHVDTIVVKTLSSAPSTDGSYDVKWRFTLVHPAPTDGYLVQKVFYYYDYTDQNGTRTHGQTKFWEAWRVQSGSQSETGDAAYSLTDEGKKPSHPCTKGIQYAIGIIRFVPKSTTGNLGDPGVTPLVPPDPSSGFGGPGMASHEPMSVSLPSTGTQPNWWDNPSFVSGENSRAVEVYWDGIPAPDHRTPMVLPHLASDPETISPYPH